MAIVNLLIAVVTILIKIILNRHASESLTNAETGCEKIYWATFWVFLLAGLVLSSFMLFYVWNCWWIGLLLLVVAVVLGPVFLCRSLKTRE